MRDLLISQQWWMFHNCTCGGSYKAKFKHPTKPGVQIHIRPNQNKWFYLQSNRIFAQGIGIDTLQTKLKEI